MRNLAFYLLFYLHPVVRLILTVMVRIGAFGAVGVLIFTAMNGTWKSVLGLTTFLFTISLVAFVAREKYVSLLLRLQPSGTDYTFFR